ncbi:MAG TPA: hypothetical protein DDX99_05115 [Desulfofustis sp.]|jgi:hypothetical protein|nr:hypothetical protein [Desulfofustis sp.]HBH32261.1 hypothetical protein [Desulfofustis sp.]
MKYKLNAPTVYQALMAAVKGKEKDFPLAGYAMLLQRQADYRSQKLFYRGGLDAGDRSPFSNPTAPPPKNY